MHVGIAGAGLLGRLLALQLAQSGHAVEVFDPAPEALNRGAAPYAAGWTAAGMLSPVAELECADERVFAQGLRSLELWPQIVATLHEVSQLPVELHQHGSLLLAHRGDEGAARRVLELLARKAPPTHAPTALSVSELRALEPSVQGVTQAWLLQGEGHIHTVQAMAALAAAGTALGVQWQWGQTVTQVAPASLQTEGSAHQITRRFDWVFDVRGTGARPDLPMRGVRGEIFWLHAPGLSLQRPVRLLHPRHRVYLVPRADDIVVVGASEIESEDRSPVSLRTTVELLAAAHSVIPELAEARIVHTETNLRPALPDNLPRLVQCDGLTRINGLFRHGWLIAPALVEEALQVMR